MATKIQDLRSITPRSNPTRRITQIKNLARHHSGGSTGDWFSFWPFWNKQRGWGTGGYHEIILRDGTLQLCYDPHEVTNGVAGHNTGTYHICVVGNGSFTAAQEKTWQERCLYNLKRFNLPVSAVKGHNEFSGSNTACPGINMSLVRQRLVNAQGGGGTVKPAQPKPPATGSIVDYLKSIGKDSSISARRKLAEEYGIKGYTGTPAQNTKLLNLLIAGKPKPQPKPEPKPVEKPKEGVRFMKLAAWQKEEMAKIYDKAAEQGIFTDKSHGEKINKDEMTVEDGIYLATVLAGAAINDPARVK